MNQDLKDYLEGKTDDVILLGINLRAGAVNRWFTDQLFAFDATVDGQTVTLEERACMAPWPKRLGNGDFSSLVQIDNVDDEITNALIGHGFSEVYCDLYLFLESHQQALGSMVQPVAVMPFRARNASLDIVAQFDCRRPDIINKKFPVDIYEPDKYPGLEQA